MRVLNKINSEPRQQFTLIGVNGENIPFELIYMPTQESWFFNISYGDWTLNGAMLTASPNCLRSYKNILPFGLSCQSSDGQDPRYIDDFTTQRIRLYLLTASEVTEIEDALFVGQPTADFVG